MIDEKHIWRGQVMIMTAAEIYEAMSKNPAFHLATVEGNQPHVRGMLLFRADENGIIFHTGTFKEVYSQIKENANAELCFHDGGTQIRVKGQLEEITGEEIINEIVNHPSREFLRGWKAQGKDFGLAVFCLKNPKVTTWSMDRNFDKTEWVDLV